MPADDDWTSKRVAARCISLNFSLKAPVLLFFLMAASFAFIGSASFGYHHIWKSCQN